MIVSFFAVAVAASLACLGALAAPVTPEMFGALPNVSQAEISPDGKTIAQIQSDGDLRVVAFYDLAREKPPTGVKLGSVKARDLRWAGPDHVLVLVSATITGAWGHGIETHEVWRFASINRTTGRVAFLFRSYQDGYFYTGAGRVYSVLPDDPTHILMGHWASGISALAGRRSNSRFSLYRVDLQNGSDKLDELGDFGTIDWVLGNSGKAAVRIDYDITNEERRFYLRDEKGSFELASTIPEKLEDDDKLRAFGAGDSAGLVRGDMAYNGYRSLCVFDVRTGQQTGCELEIPGYDIEWGITDPHTDAVVGAYYVADMPATRFIDSGLQDVQSALERALPGAAITITSWSADRRKFMITAKYSDHPPQFFLFDRESKWLDMTAASYDALDGKAFAAKKKYDYTSSDGLLVRGYLTVPAGARTESMPLIVMPHGGPQARDDQSFDWWAFFYAARGYLVYQPNFRGSSGFGDEYLRAGYLQWGRKMQDDITEGVNNLIADGIADPSRICIVGASYGGYAALAGATLTPDLYACAVSVAGVSSIPAQIAYQTDRGAVPEDAWDVRIGSRVDDNAALQEVSPYYRAHKARAPIMLIHGKDDVVVPIGQSRMMEEALRPTKVKVEFVELPGEDHWLSSGETRTEMLARSIEFIDRYIGAKGDAAAN